MPRPFRMSILLGAPLFVGVINWFHPVYFKHTGIYSGIHNVVDWWITLHILNLFGFALVGLAAFLLVKDLQGAAATVATIALAVFVPTYAGFDSLIGIGTGILVRYARGVPLDQMAILNPAIDAYWANGVATALALAGSVAWGVSMTAIAVAHAEPRRRPALIALGLLAGALTGWGYSASTFGTLPWWTAVGVIGLLGLVIARPSWSVSLFIVSGILFGTTHVVPFGPLGMACFIAGTAVSEFSPRRIITGGRMTTVPS
jgi:hypothetical protein